MWRGLGRGGGIAPGSCGKHHALRPLEVPLRLPERGPGSVVVLRRSGGASGGAPANTSGALPRPPTRLSHSVDRRAGVRA